MRNRCLLFLVSGAVIALIETIRIEAVLAIPWPEIIMAGGWRLDGADPRLRQNFGDDSAWALL